MDLSVGFGVVGQWDHPKMSTAREKLVNACKKHGKIAGMIAGNEDQIAQSIAEGFAFISYSSDSSLVVKGMSTIAATFRKHREAHKS